MVYNRKINFKNFVEVNLTPTGQTPVSPQQTPFDRNVLRQLNNRLGQPGSMAQGGGNFKLSSEEISQVNRMLAQAKQRIVAELTGSLSQQFQQYKSWEDAAIKNNSSALLNFRSDVLPNAIKNGGSSTPVQVDQKSAVSANAEHVGITVPTELYNALYWRNVIKNMEKEMQEVGRGQNPYHIKTLLPLLATLFK